MPFYKSRTSHKHNSFSMMPEMKQIRKNRVRHQKLLDQRQSKSAATIDTIIANIVATYKPKNRLLNAVFAAICLIEALYGFTRNMRSNPSPNQPLIRPNITSLATNKNTPSANCTIEVISNSSMNQTSFNDTIAQSSSAAAIRYNPNCLEGILAVDIGSGGTKIKSAIVDKCTGKISEIGARSYSIGYRAELNKSLNNTFSRAIQEEGLKVIQEAQTEFHAKTSGMKKSGCAIATAAFRSAKNGNEVAAKFSESLHLPVEILSQEDEGKIAYHAAITMIGRMGFQFHDPIIWDIGSGSMQFSHFEPSSDTFTMCGNEVAAETVSHMITSKIPSNSSIIATEFTPEQIHTSIEMIKQALTSSDPACEIIAHKIATGSEVLGVGPLHSKGVLLLINAVLGKEDTSYTLNDLRTAISMLKDATPEQLLQYAPDLNPHFLKNEFLNLLLTFATMEHYQFSAAKVTSASNADAIIFSGCHKANYLGKKKPLVESSSSHSLLKIDTADKVLKAVPVTPMSI